MDSELLHVVSAVSNPMRWESRTRLAKNFIEHMLDSKVGSVTIVETALGDRPFELAHIPHIKHIPTRAKTVVWSKESALMVGARSLPPDAKYWAWLDADTTYHNPDWAAETVHALQIYPVVQTWTEALDLNPKGRVLTVKGQKVATSFGWVWQEFQEVTSWWKVDKNGQSYFPYGHPGFGWSSSLDWLWNVGGLLTHAPVGASDNHMSLAMVGEIGKATSGISADSYRAYLKSWSERCYRATQGRVGAVPGLISHHWHGNKEGKMGRGYSARAVLLQKHDFCPLNDVYLNRDGILELTGEKPALERSILKYMSSREEDANIVVG